MKAKYTQIVVGQQFVNDPINKLPILINKTYRVECTCSCGSVKLVKTHNLLSGKSKSCGCVPQKAFIKKLTGQPSKHRTTAAKKAINQIWNSYKFGAQKRLLSFSLTRVEFEQLLHQECVYCGKNNSNTKNNINGSFSYNGIDRVDSNIGYETLNVVACCRTCNIMKNDLPLDQFYEHVNAVKNHLPRNSFKPTKTKLDYLHAKALATASASHDIHTKVGSLILDPNTGATLAEGHNGFVRQAPDAKLPTSRPEKYDYMIHAEVNAICHAGRQGTNINGGICYTTLSPCIQCLRFMWQAGIKEFYFKEKYRDFDQCTSMLDLSVNVTEKDGFFHMLVSPRK